MDVPSRFATPLLPSFPLITKRRHSTAFPVMISGASMPTPLDGATLAGPARKRQASGPTALMFLSDQLSDFTDAYRAGTAAETGSRNFGSSPERKTMAIERAQDLESDLDNIHLVALIGLFQTDVSAADAYLALKRDGLRKVWVAANIAGITASGSRAL